MQKKKLFKNTNTNRKRKFLKRNNIKKQKWLASFLTGIIISLLLSIHVKAENSNDMGNDVVKDNDTSVSPVYCKEIKIEIEKLKKLRLEVEKKIEEDKKILKQIKEEKEKLRKEREDFEKYIKQIQEERYKKLAKMFEKMDPELAGDKISRMKDPKVAAYILFNMKERKAGEVLNYVDPKMVNKITKILTDIKRTKSK